VASVFAAALIAQTMSRISLAEVAVGVTKLPWARVQLVAYGTAVARAQILVQHAGLEAWEVVEGRPTVRTRSSIVRLPLRSPRRGPRRGRRRLVGSGQPSHGCIAFGLDAEKHWHHDWPAAILVMDVLVAAVEVVADVQSGGGQWTIAASDIEARRF